MNIFEPSEATIAKIQMIIGFGVIVLAMVGALLGGLYWVMCQLSLVTMRLVTILSMLCVPGAILLTWRLASTSAREHLRGFERGLEGAEKTISSVGRGLSATARLARADNAKHKPVGQPDFTDLLPPVASMQIVPTQNKGVELIEL